MDAIFNKLAVTTPTDLEVVLTRSFDAPAHLVFDCLTQVEHVRKWWGCEESEATFEIDLRVGGKWRFVLFMAEEGTQGFHGVYREIARPTRLVYTFIYEPFPDNGAIITILLTERAGRTTLTETILHETKQDRDNCLATGFDKGASTSYNRLENLLLEMQEAGQ